MAIALDQDIGFSGNSTTAITVSGTFPAGALICVCVGFATATSGQSISQSGNAFTSIVTRENSATNNLVYFAGYIANWAGGALSTTFTLSGTGKDAGARLLSFTGVVASSALELSNDAGGAPKATTMNSGAASGTTGATDLLVGFFTWANNDIGGTITESGTPASGWTKTADSTGSSGNTPHGNATFTYQILSSAATNPDASITFTTPSAGVSYSATVASFAALATENGAANLQETMTASALPGGATALQEVFSGSALPGGAASLQETFAGSALPGGAAELQEVFTGQATGNVITPGIAALQETFNGQALPGGAAALQETFIGQAVPGGAAGLQLVFTGQAIGVVVQLLMTPVGVAAGIALAGSAAAGLRPIGTATINQPAGMAVRQ